MWLSPSSTILLPLLLHSFVTLTSAAGGSRTKEFDLTVTWEDYAPDGFSRKMLLVNGQSPGPLLEFNQDDQVVVRVHNQSPQNLTIHYHGLEMKGTPWSDGVPGVTQHPVQPGSSFTHKFKATQYGSYWYHSHFQSQIEDGLYGPIIIHPRPDEPSPFHLITKDKETVRAMQDAVNKVKPLIISDFVHITADEKWNMTMASGVEDSCYDSILFNGKGRVECLSRDVIDANTNKLQKAYLAAVPGGAEMTDKGCLPASATIAFAGLGGDKDAILPGTFSGCRDTKGEIEVIRVSKKPRASAAWLALDVIGATNYVTGVFSIDSHEVWVYAMDGSYIEPQRVQAIPVVNGDRFSILVKVNKSGRFHIRYNGDSATQMIAGHAILSVDGYGPAQDSEPYISLVGVPVSEDVVVFNQTVAYPYPPSPISPTADATFNLSMTLDGASYHWALNSTVLTALELDHQKPTLFHPQPYANNNVTISTRANQWVDLVLITGIAPQPRHPIHKHGTKMYKIGSGTGHFRWSSVEDAIKEVPDRFNLVNPPRRDAFASLAAHEEPTWVVVRYHASDPGPWLLHCHINSHVAGGMSMVIQDGVDQWPTVPEEYAEGGNGE
ncbi:hypothetical protein F66182_6432 [Fusarium sp. NRRL 66182]|nr:hypothetical protein F66182_6432 [Fusarium sp. NRRL 66182]